MSEHNTLRGRLAAIRAVVDNKNEVSAAAFYAIDEHLKAITGMLDNAQVQQAPPAFYKDDAGVRYRLVYDPLLVGVGCGNAKKDTPKEHA